MKKLLILTLCLAMAMLPALGVAETATDLTGYLTATDPDGVYGFAYPEDYQLLDKTTVSNALDAAASNDQLSAAIEKYRSAIESSNMVMLLSPDLSTNFNIVVQDMGVEFTADQLLASADSFVTQLKASIPNLEVIEEPALIDGNDTFQPMVLGYSFEMNNMTLNGYQGYFCKGTKFFVVTLTAQPDVVTSELLNDFGFIMGSIAIQ